MPDPSKSTVSASQAPALFGLSPYCTRWMLHKHFAEGLPIEADESERLDWGRRLEPAILRAAADQIRCDIKANDGYFHHPSEPVGATGDGFVFDPQRGLGVIECKNVDWLRWRDTWTDTEAAPHVEIQHQTQLMIPHPEHGFPKWGVIAVLIGGNDLKLYQREGLPGVQAKIAIEARTFLAGVRDKIEPAVEGRAIELDGLHWALPRVDREKVLRETDFAPEDALTLARLIEEYHNRKALASVTEKTVKELQARIEGMIGDAAEIIVHQRRLKVSRSAIAGGSYERKAYTRVMLTPSILDFAPELPEQAAEADELTPFGLPKDILV